MEKKVRELTEAEQELVSEAVKDYLWEFVRQDPGFVIDMAANAMTVAGQVAFLLRENPGALDNIGFNPFE